MATRKESMRVHTVRTFCGQLPTVYKEDPGQQQMHSNKMVI